VALKTRDREKVFLWFKELFRPDTKAGAGFHLKSGVYHDAAGSRQEFSAHLRAWNGAVRERVEAEKRGSA
jgi:hypothetical protein